jgi:hypothetical protein
MRHYERLGTVALEEVFPLILRRLENPQAAPKVIELLGAQVKISGLRLRTFAEGPLCCSNPECKSIPTHFAIERDKGNPWTALPSAPITLISMVAMSMATRCCLPTITPLLAD